jgi:hypothetical protein
MRVAVVTLWAFIGELECQPLRQVLRGKITDAITGAAVPRATIELEGQHTFSTSSDSSGSYSLQADPGNYFTIITHPDFKSAVRAHVTVVSGKQEVLNIALEHRTDTMKTVVVQADREGKDFSLDFWKVQNFAAVFYDPARVVNSHAGAIAIDDGTNHMAVRGTPPGYIQWKLEEAEIVNPNHLENGGTVSDRASVNGGGVSMISAQLLERSAFLFAPFDALQGNSLSGIFDMRFRNGNNERPEHIVQASLLGTDLSTEGPIGKKNRASYLVNFRYSTLALLSKLGVDFGDEKLSFADISYAINVPYKRGYMRVFGLNGTSDNFFAGKDSALVAVQKDAQQIHYHSGTQINGLTTVNRIGSGAFIKSVVVYSGKSTLRDASAAFDNTLMPAQEHDGFDQKKLSTLNYVSSRLGARASLRAGTYAGYFTSTMRSASATEELNATLSEPVVQPFISGEVHLSPGLSFLPGLHAMYLPRTGFSHLQPRVAVRYDHPVIRQITLSYGASAQLQNQLLVLSSPLNRNLRPTTGQALSFAHLYTIRSVSIRNELYYQTFASVPVDTVTGFSAFNYFNEQVFAPLQQNGTARVFGYDIRLEKSAGQFYFVASSSIYRSLYSIPGKTNESAARFSTGHNIFLTAGREQKLKRKDHFWRVDLRGIHRTGFFESGDSVPAASVVFKKQLPDYWRVDLRLSYKKNRLKSTVIWALDIQNVTNRLNTAYHYHDMVTRRMETKYNLGLIPVLSYKVMF